MRVEERLGRGPAAVVGWLRAHPLLADGLLAVLLAAVSLIALGYAGKDCDGGCRPGDAGAVALVLLQTLPLAWRRRHPLAIPLVAGLASAAYGVAPYPDLTMSVPIGGLVAAYTTAAWCSRRTALIVGGVIAVILGVVVLTPATDADLSDAAFGSLALASAWILGDSARTHRAYTAELEDRAARLERERAVQAQRAVAEERTRIARELHDVVAHHVSMMVVQAEAGPVVVERDPAKAAGAFDAIAATGRQALVEMRRLLAVLRGDGRATPSLAPQPGLAQVPILVEQVRRAGLPVELTVEGEPRPLPAGVDLSAYRIVQEALTNAVKHAGPGRALVVVRYGERDLELQVSDDGRGGPAGGNGAGQGLLGMRERVNLFGGELHAGPLPAGGFRVAARLPIGTGG
jgi:signal transduction histidine kinase